ncbi:hypothetical protein V499_07098 [Pseudogymnoascus sp. VKM F-103]|nr:hypothetical protein V499_07098 [Pseudogymnoascus sp. VKM F-103]
MLLLRVISSFLAIPLVAGFLVAPLAGSTPAPLTVSDCSGWVVVTSSMTCTSIATTYGITIAKFEAMNPILGPSCQLIDSFAFCIEENFGGAAPTSASGCTTLVTITTPTTITTATTTSAGNGISTPTPYQSGMTTSCNSFRLVIADDQCGTIATEAGAGYCLCIGVIGGSTPTKSLAPSTTSPGNDVSTPTPIQLGMTSSCGAFHLVQANDQCGAIATSAGISLKQFCAWNPSVSTACSTLFAGDYVCISLAPCAAISPLPSRNYYGRVRLPVAVVGVRALVSYNTGSPYVSSLSACSTKCSKTLAYTSFFFV